MISAEPESEPEVVQFSNTVMAAGIVETWLGNIEAMMRISLYDNTKAGYFGYPLDVPGRRPWFMEYPAQCILVIDMMKWTELAEQAISNVPNDKDAIGKAYEEMVLLINDMVQMVRGDLSFGLRETIKSLMVLDVHNRDILEQLHNDRIDSLNDFQWSKQLRYYWDVDPIEDCFARQTNTRFRYCYEYLGNGSRLVITPLTDKCYVTLTGALNLYFGGAPAGPAGTGKTETTKDLAKALAVQCIVFNCSDSLEYKTMGRFFAGLAQCGAWACFDEFNRIGIEVLSVIAQQILTIQNAVRQRQEELDFEGKVITLNWNFGVFITMNPGYAGRTELPDNLKALFRPVAMMIPDYALIAEIILFSEGFVTARQLSTKMVYLYKLSSEQLSKQKHYDFGMRAVKSVLVMAGTLTRKNPEDPEDIVLLKAMRDSNVPKFLKIDLKLFFGIIEDLFPGKTVELAPHSELKAVISAILKERLMQEPDIFMTKIIQLLETIIVRHGLMTVGATGTGKTELVHVLQAALTRLHTMENVEDDPLFRQTKIYALNPKSITQEELFGFNDIYTNTFTHGIVSKIITGALEESNDIKKWVHFDGPVDAGWIENMNTVLDDNKMLCLPDGRRIKLPSAFTMMFEVQDLAVASPATVSRCGMVYLDTNMIESKIFIDTWSLHFRERERQNAILKDPKKEEGWELPNSFNKFFELIHKIFDEHLHKIREKCKETIPSFDCNLVTSCLKIIDCLWEEYQEIANLAKSPLKESEQEVFLSMIFIFAFIWSVGGNLNDGSRHKLNEEMRINFIRVCQNIPEGDLYDYYIDLNTRKFKPWSNLVTDFKYDSSISYFNILVDTTDTARFKYLLRLMNKKANNVLIMAESGVGKSVIIKDYLNNLPEEQFVNTSMNFSAQTSSANIQDVLFDKLSQRGKNLGPPSGKKMVLFVDDINMPKLDTYGAQPPNEFLRQMIDQGGFYDLKKYVFKGVKDLCMVAACAPPVGGRNPVTPRLFRHFHMLWMPQLAEKSMLKIFSSILKGYLNEGGNTKGFEKTAENIIKASIHIYTFCTETFLPTPTKPMYTFNLRDLSKVIQGCLQMSHENITSTDELVSLWLHEECRIFKDRLSDDPDRDQFLKLAISKVKSFFNIDIEAEAIDD
jgi:dynein heavy chain